MSRTLQFGRLYNPSAAAILIELFSVLKLLPKMDKRRSIPHPELDLVRLRPWRDDKDLPEIQDYLIADDFGE